MVFTLESGIRVQPWNPALRMAIYHLGPESDTDCLFHTGFQILHCRTLPNPPESTQSVSIYHNLLPCTVFRIFCIVFSKRHDFEKSSQETKKEAYIKPQVRRSCRGHDNQLCPANRLDFISLVGNRPQNRTFSKKRCSSGKFLCSRAVGFQMKSDIFTLTVN